MLINPVAVEKLARHEFAEIASPQKARQTIFPSLLDIFYHPIVDFFQKNRLFQQPQDFPTLIQFPPVSTEDYFRVADHSPRIAGWAPHGCELPIGNRHTRM
jgi:hypothetical protein